MADNTSAALHLAAPVRIPVRPKAPVPQKPQVVRKKKKSGAERAREAVQTILHSAKVFAVCASLLVMMTVLIFQRAQLTALNNKQYRLNNTLSEVKSDTVRLESEFNRLVSVDSVEEYARSELGMVKRQKYQIHFFRNEGTDEIRIPGVENE